MPIVFSDTSFQTTDPLLLIAIKVLSDLKSGRRDFAEFWINLRGRKIYIRYLAVRDKDGQYLGTLEVGQDITEIKQIEGEKRLLEY